MDHIAIVIDKGQDHITNFYRIRLYKHKTFTTTHNEGEHAPSIYREGDADSTFHHANSFRYDYLIRKMLHGATSFGLTAS